MEGVFVYNQGMFIDEAEIEVKSGKGGDGMVHFHREKFVPARRPRRRRWRQRRRCDSRSQAEFNTLQAFRHVTHYFAKDGKNGGPKNMSGKSADDLIIFVPPGTVVHDADSGELIGDLTKANERLTICKSGRGGRGNQHFATSRNQVPRTAEKGEPGEAKRLKLELKLHRRYWVDRCAERGQVNIVIGVDQCEAENRALSVYNPRSESRRGRCGR